MSKDIKDIPIATLLPHEAPMIFIDGLISADDENAMAHVTLDKDHFAAVNGEVPSYVGIELMAQTVAAWAGYHERIAGRDVKVGFLLGARRYKVSTPVLPLNVKLQIVIKVELMAENGLSAFTCEILNGNENLASSMINVFQAPADFELT